MNHKTVQRLWREEGLRVPQRRRRKRLGASTTTTVPVTDAPNKVWAVDFQFDATTDGRPVKIVSVVDEHTRECLGGLVERSVTGDDLIDELDRLAAQRGYPAVLRCDNGPELVCAALAGDKGSSSPSARAEVRRRGIRAVIPTKSNQPRQPGFDRVAYRARNKVERAIGRLKQFRRVATRYEKDACNYLAMVELAAALIWL